MTSDRTPICISASLRQATAATFRRWSARRPYVYRVEAGAKRIRGRGTTITVEAGAFGILPEHEELTLENLPPEDGPYRASVLGLSAELVGRVMLRHPPVVPASEDLFRCAAFPELTTAFDAARRAAADPDPLPRSIVEHRAIEVLIWLREVGVAFPEPPTEGQGDRPRRLVEVDVSRRWTAREASRALGTSEATLRRRLRSEDASFSDVLSETRVAFALRPLQTTTLPVAEVARRVGYDSPSRFSRRFAARLGLTPSAVRTRSGEAERIGPPFDRIGTRQDPQAP